MTTASWIYFVLLAYPGITLLTPDPDVLRWWLRTGGAAPVPADVEQAKQQNQGNLLIAKFFLVIFVCFLMMWHVPLRSGSLGLRWSQPGGMIVVAGIAVLLLVYWTFRMRSLAMKVPPEKKSLGFLIREPAPKILFIIVLGAFAEEFWRALSLMIFDKSRVSNLLAVLLTSIVFGIGHLFSFKSVGAALGKLLAPTVGGVLLAALFLYYQNLFVPMIVHVLVNSFGAVMGRKRLVMCLLSTGTLDYTVPLSDPSENPLL